jgi:hypothetical protein
MVYVNKHKESTIPERHEITGKWEKPGKEQIVFSSSNDI